MPRLFILFGLLLGVMGCPSTTFVNTWKSPEAQPTNWKGKNVAAFVITFENALRLAAEDSLALELSTRGVKGVAGYKLMSDEELKDQDKAKQILKEQGIEGAVLMRVVGQQQEVYQSPGALMATGTYAYPTFWGYWGYGWTSTYVPGQIGTDTIVRVETLIYSVPQNNLLWAGTSKTTNPKDLDKTIKDLVDAAGKEIRKAGLLAK